MEDRQQAGDTKDDAESLSESGVWQEVQAEHESRRGTGFWNVAQSVAAAMIGVQSRKNKERDFQHGKHIHFIVGGVLGTLLFLLAIWLLVQFLLATS